MQKNITKIIFIVILSLVFFKPLISHAALSATTGTADNITDTEATLHGTAAPDLTLNPKLPTTAYFRYSNTAIAPVFCNDIYGSDMVSTKDIKNFNENGGAQPFFQKITNLQPSTTYHYCSIVSNPNKDYKQAIAYGAVESFTTAPCSTCAHTTVTTKYATGINSTSVNLNGTYTSTDAVTTYFEYKKDTTWIFNPNTVVGQNSASLNPQVLAALLNAQNNTNTLNLNPVSMNTSVEPSLLGNQLNTNPGIYSQNTATLNPQAGTLLNTTNTTPFSGVYSQNTTSINPQALSAWTRVGDQSHNANTLGNITFPLTGLTPNTKYNFVFKAEKADGTQITGSILNFKTIATDGGGGIIDTSTCPTGWVGIYPNCSNPTPDTGGGTGYGGGTGGGYGGGTGTGGTGTTTGGTTTTVLTVGTVATPPGDATVHAGEGIETVFARQIVANKNLAKLYGYQEGTNLQSFAWSLADFFAKVFGYVSASGKEVRVSQPDIAAYQIQIIANKITVYEYYNSRIINIQSLTSSLKNTSGYEYYFNKK